MLAFAHTALTWLLPFLFVLTLVVTVHELGHFLVARACGVAVDRFSIGFGRALIHWRDRAGIEWRIAWIPLGGYVRFAGDANMASVPDAEGLAEMRREIIARDGPAALRSYFHFKPLWQRALVVLAGPVANFALSILLFTVLLLAFGSRDLPARVYAIEPGSPAQRAGFQPGDLITRAAGQQIDGSLDLQQIVQLRAGTPITFVVRRGTTLIDLTATPRRERVDDQMGGAQNVGVLGLLAPPHPVIVTRRYGPVEALGAGCVQTWRVLDTTLFYLGRVIRGQDTAEMLGGPLRIAKASHAIAKAGAAGAHSPAAFVIGVSSALLSLVAVISVSIGFMNLLPIPVLDGGHLLFYAYEAIAGRPVGAAVQTAGYRVGLALLLGLMLFATTNDLQRPSIFHFLGGLFS